MRRNFILVSLICLSILTIAGCGKKEQRIPVLNYWGSWSPTDPGGKAIYKLIDEFNVTHPRFKVKPSWISWNDMDTKLLTAIAGGSPPDIVLMDRFVVTSFASRGALTELDTYIQQNNIEEKDFFEATWAESSYGGHVWAIPQNTDVRALFYRVDAFREAGLDPDRPPKTWQELEKYADKLTKYNEREKLVRVGFAPTWGDDYLYMYGWLNGGRFMTEDGRKVTANEPEVVEALKWMVKIRDKYGIKSLNAFSGGFGQRGMDPFIMGKVAMKIDGDWNIAVINKYAPNLEYRVAPPPAPEGKKTLSWSGGFAWAIPKGSKYPDEAFEFIKFMVSKDSQLKFGKTAWVIPALKQAAQDPFYLDNDKYRPFIKLMEVAKYRPVTPVARCYWQQLVEATEYSFFHKKEPQQALDEVAKKVQEELNAIIKKKEMSE